VHAHTHTHTILFRWAEICPNNFLLKNFQIYLYALSSVLYLYSSLFCKLFLSNSYINTSYWCKISVLPIKLHCSSDQNTISKARVCTMCSDLVPNLSSFPSVRAQYYFSTFLYICKRDKLTDNYCGCTLIIGNSHQNLQFSNRITYNTNFIHIHT